MIKKILFSLIVSFSIFAKCEAQVVSESYYKDKYFSKKTSAKKGKYKITTSIENGRKVIEYINLKKNKSFKKFYTSGEPTGLWVVNKNETLDYNFELHYNEVKCDDTLVNNTKDSVLIKKEENKLLQFLIKNTHYPNYAAENGITGIVYVTIIFAADGTYKESSIFKKVHPSLDKEAMRVGILYYRSNPYPIKNDKSYCLTFPISFQIE